MFYSNMYLSFITLNSNIRLAVPKRKVVYGLICKLDMIKILRCGGSLVGDSSPKTSGPLVSEDHAADTSVVLNKNCRGGDWRLSSGEVSNRSICPTSRPTPLNKQTSAC